MEMGGLFNPRKKLKKILCFRNLKSLFCKLECKIRHFVIQHRVKVWEKEEEEEGRHGRL